MTEQRWRRPEPGGDREPAAAAGTDAQIDVDAALPPAYHDEVTASGNHGDLVAELAAAAPRRWRNRATSYLGAAALLVGGFVAGVEVQQAYGEPGTPAGAVRSAGGGNLAGLLGADSGGGRQSSGADPTAAASATTGKVKLVDGSTVYLETVSGEVITVRTNGQTKVQAATPSSLKNLAVGDSVTVQGRSSGDGTVTATTVTKTK